MMFSLKYLLDTNACISYLNYPDSSIWRKIESTPSVQIAVCSVVKAELFFGSKKSKNPVRSLAIQETFLNNFHSLFFNDEAAMMFGEIRASLARQGTPIGPYDLQIAAIALANDLTLVTHNTKEFTRVADLKIEDWEI